MPEARGGGQEEQPHAQGQRRWPGGATPQWLCRCSWAAQEWQAAERRYPTSKVRSTGQKDIPHVKGKEQWLHFAGAAVKRYPTPKVRETQLRW